MLRLKALMVGSTIGEMAGRVRWWLGAIHRYKYPELWEIYLEERRLPLILRKLLKPDSTVIDVGCHIGSFLSLALSISPNGHHVAFEASPTKAAWLQSKFPGVEIVGLAVSDRAGSAQFEENLERPSYSRLAVSASSIEVGICTLDARLAEKDRIDLIKIDIEGGELAALRGAVSTISSHRPAIIFECGSEYFLDSHGLSRRDLYDFITEKLGYRIYDFGDFLAGKEEMTYGEFRKSGLYPFRAFNFVALPQSNPTPIHPG
jgi:FkbM family methyltransferase